MTCPKVSQEENEGPGILLWSVQEVSGSDLDRLGISAQLGGGAQLANRPSCSPAWVWLALSRRRPAVPSHHGCQAAVTVTVTVTQPQQEQ